MKNRFSDMTLTEKLILIWERFRRNERRSNKLYEYINYNWLIQFCRWRTKNIQFSEIQSAIKIGEKPKLTEFPETNFLEQHEFLNSFEMSKFSQK